MRKMVRVREQFTAEESNVIRRENEQDENQKTIYC